MGIVSSDAEKAVAFSLLLRNDMHPLGPSWTCMFKRQIQIHVNIINACTYTSLLEIHKGNHYGCVYTIFLSM